MVDPPEMGYGSQVRAEYSMRILFCYAGVYKITAEITLLKCDVIRYHCLISFECENIQYLFCISVQSGNAHL